MAQQRDWTAAQHLPPILHPICSWGWLCMNSPMPWVESPMARSLIFLIYSDFLHPGSCCLLKISLQASPIFPSMLEEPISSILGSLRIRVTFFRQRAMTLSQNITRLRPYRHSRQLIKRCWMHWGFMWGYSHPHLRRRATSLPFLPISVRSRPPVMHSPIRVPTLPSISMRCTPIWA